MICNNNKVNYNETKRESLFIDVRSPFEYAQDHIPNAINIPLLTDEERCLVGTTYVQESKTEAKRIAARMVAPKLPLMLDQILELKEKTQGENIVCYCERGGYRSTFFSAIFNSVDIFIKQLDGGYKGYRSFVAETLPTYNQEINYIVLHGATGTGKTDILHSLKNLGHDILDLEGAANHRGSHLGSIGLSSCHSQKRFESNIFNQLDCRKSNTVFIEAESKRIGKTIIPEYIFEKMARGTHIHVDSAITYRLNVLRKDYMSAETWQEDALKVVPFITKRIGNSNAQALSDWISEGDFDSAATFLMEHYYDPMYHHKGKQIEYYATVENRGSAEQAAQEIIKATQELGSLYLSTKA